MAKFSKIKFIVRKRALGDVLWIEPVLRRLAESGQQIKVHTRYNELFENFPYKNVSFIEQLTFAQKLMIRSAGLIPGLPVINLDNSYEQRPEVHFLEAYERKADLPFVKEYPRLYLSDREKSLRANEAPYAIIHFESFSTRPYRDLKNFPVAALVRQLKARGLKVFQAGTTGQSVEGAVPLKASLRDLIGYISNADMFAGIDSGPSHLAASLGTKSLIFFGALNPNLRHFPELLNGMAIKQICGKTCNNNLKDDDPVSCEFVEGDRTPPCCLYSEEKVKFYLDQLMK